MTRWYGRAGLTVTCPRGVVIISADRDVECTCRDCQRQGADHCDCGYHLFHCVHLFQVRVTGFWKRISWDVCGFSRFRTSIVSQCRKIIRELQDFFFAHLGAYQSKCLRGLLYGCGRGTCEVRPARINSSPHLSYLLLRAWNFFGASGAYQSKSTRISISARSRSSLRCARRAHSSLAAAT